MHKDFAEWYRLAGITPTSEVLVNRWAAIEEYEPERNQVIDLTRLFYRVGVPSDAFLAEFRVSFQNKDAAFEMRGNDHELSVLAGAELIEVIERANTNLADLSALSLVCASAQNLRRCPSVKEIPELAATYLNKRALNRALAGNDSVNAESIDDLFTALTELGAPYVTHTMMMHIRCSEIYFDQRRTH